MACSGKTAALMHGCCAGSISRVEQALRQGVDIDCTDEFHRTPLMMACKKGNEEMVKLLLKHGADVKAEDDNERTALTNAFYHEHDNIVRLLLQHGASTDEEDPLELACRLEYEDVVESLLQKEVSHRDGTKALIYLCANSREGMLKLLLQHGVKFDIAGGVSGVPNTIVSLFEKNNKILELFLQYDGIDVNAQDENKTTALILASKMGKANVVSSLLQHGADVNASDWCGLTPRERESNDIQKTRKILQPLLMSNTDNKNQYCVVNKSAIMCAAEADHLDCVETLLTGGADLDQKDATGCTVLSYALSKPSLQCLRFLLVDGKLLNEGKLKPVHKNLRNEAKSMKSLLYTIEHGIFEWEWCCYERLDANRINLNRLLEAVYSNFSFSKLEITDVKNLILAALKAGFCPGNFNYLDMKISPLIFFFLQNDTDAVKILLDYLYYFPEDFTILSTDNAITERIENTTLLQQTTRQPLSLATWSFLAVSKAISLAGPPGLRGPRVESLPIPDTVKRRLKFTLDYSEPRIQTIQSVQQITEPGLSGEPPLLSFEDTFHITPLSLSRRSISSLFETSYNYYYESDEEFESYDYFD